VIYQEHLLSISLSRGVWIDTSSDIVNKMDMQNMLKKIVRKVLCLLFNIWVLIHIFRYMYNSSCGHYTQFQFSCKKGKKCHQKWM